MRKSDKREEEILNFIKRQIEDVGYPPSMRELCNAVGLKSTSSAHFYINRLVKKGYIKRKNGNSRALSIAENNLNKKTADELFKELGYECRPTRLTKNRYEKITENHIYNFIFNERMKIFSKTCDYGKTHIEPKELKAINIKCKELGWEV